jgi:hypothetical protein
LVMAGQKEATIVVPTEDENEEQRQARLEKEKIPFSRRPDNRPKPEDKDPYAELVTTILPSLDLIPVRMRKIAF